MRNPYLVYDERVGHITYNADGVLIMLNTFQIDSKGHYIYERHILESNQGYKGLVTRDKYAKNNSFIFTPIDNMDEHSIELDVENQYRVTDGTSYTIISSPVIEQSLIAIS
mgnify:FL=1